MTATNVATNVASTTTTNAKATTRSSYLTPGHLHRDGGALRIQETVAAGHRGPRRRSRSRSISSLEVGRVEETVSVTAESPLLELGQRVGGPGDRREAHRADAAVGRQPVRAVAARAGRRLHRRPEVLAAVRQRRHARRSTPTASTGGNEFTLDGSPNMANGRRVAFVPPAGAVQEFKVETASFDAADGHTAGATVNVTLKSGTNAAQGRGLLLHAGRKAVGDRLLRQQERRPRSRRSATTAPAAILAARCVIPGSTTAATGRSSSARSNGSTTSSPSPVRRPCRPRRCATATSRRCSRRASIIYDPLHRAARSAPASSARRSRATSFRRTASTRSRTQVLNYYPLPNQPGDAQRQQQLLLRQSADRRLLLDLDFASITG